MIIVSYGFLIVSFYSVAHADTCDEFGVLTTTTPAPPHDEWAWRVYAQELAAVTAGPIDLVLVGNSLAQAWDMKMWAPKKVLNLESAVIAHNMCCGGCKFAVVPDHANGGPGHSWHK